MEDTAFSYTSKYALTYIYAYSASEKRFRYFFQGAFIEYSLRIGPFLIWHLIGQYSH